MKNNQGTEYKNTLNEIPKYIPALVLHIERQHDEMNESKPHQHEGEGIPDFVPCWLNDSALSSQLTPAYMGREQCL